MTDGMIRTPSGQMSAYVAAPAAGAPWPGVVVVHDFGGMSHDLRNQADWLAGEEYLAAASDLYYWGSRLRCLWTIMREIAAGHGRTFDDIDSVRGWLARQDRCTGKIGVIGFCMGGPTRWHWPPATVFRPPASTTAAARRTPSRPWPVRARSWAATAARTARRWAAAPRPAGAGAERARGRP